MRVYRLPTVSSQSSARLVLLVEQSSMGLSRFVQVDWRPKRVARNRLIGLRSSFQFLVVVKNRPFLLFEKAFSGQSVLPRVVEDARQYLPIGMNAPIGITVRRETLITTLQDMRVLGTTGRPHWEIKKVCEYLLSMV